MSPSVAIWRPQLYSIMTTEPNGVVEPVHEKAMPVMLLTPEDVDCWSTGGSLTTHRRAQLIEC